MTVEQAKAKVEEWKEHAAKQGEDSKNTNGQKVVLSLFDLTGKWSQPWVDAGYNVFRFDIQEDEDVGNVNNFSVEFFDEMFSTFDGMEVHAILAGCPCTDFASSGAKHFYAKDNTGQTWDSVKLVKQTLATIEYFKPAIWAIENPVGRIERLANLPPWRLSFQPNNFGDPYTKETMLWGRFNADLPIAPVEPVEGSKMHSKYGGKSIATKNARSETPEGFAYAFFMANNAVDQPLQAIHGQFDRLDKGLMQKALDAGITPNEIEDAVQDSYYQDLDDEGGNEILQELIDDRTEDEPLTKYDNFRLMTPPDVGDLQTHTPKQAGAVWDKASAGKRGLFVGRRGYKDSNARKKLIASDWADIPSELQKELRLAIDEENYSPSWYINTEGRQVSYIAKPAEVRSPEVIAMEQGAERWKLTSQRDKLNALYAAGVGADAENAVHSKWDSLGPDVREKITEYLDAEDDRKFTIPRPKNWETNYGSAKKVADDLAMPTRGPNGKNLKVGELVASIKAFDTALAKAKEKAADTPEIPPEKRNLAKTVQEVVQQLNGVEDHKNLLDQLSPEFQARLVGLFNTMVNDFADDGIPFPKSRNELKIYDQPSYDSVVNKLKAAVDVAHQLLADKSGKGVDIARGNKAMKLFQGWDLDILTLKEGAGAVAPGVEYGNPVNGKPRAADVTPEESLLLMPCSAGKLTEAARAKQLYTGVMWQTLNTHIGAKAKPQMVILSAEHGFIDPDDKIDPYERLMDAKRADELLKDPQELVDAVLDSIDPDVKIKDVQIVGGAEYRKVMKEVVSRLIASGQIASDASVNETTGGIGEQRKQLGTYLKDLAGQEVEPTPAEATLNRLLDASDRVLANNLDSATHDVSVEFLKELRDLVNDQAEGKDSQIFKDRAGYLSVAIDAKESGKPGLGRKMEPQDEAAAKLVSQWALMKSVDRYAAAIKAGFKDKVAESLSGRSWADLDSIIQEKLSGAMAGPVKQAAAQFTENATLSSPTSLDDFVASVEAGNRAHFDYNGKHGRTVWIEQYKNGWVIKSKDDDSQFINIKGGAGLGNWAKFEAMKAVRGEAEHRFTKWSSKVQDFVDGVTDEAPTVEEVADELSPLTQAINFLAQLEQRQAENGRIEDDRLNTKISQQKQVIRELEAAENKNASTPSKEDANAVQSAPTAELSAEDATRVALAKAKIEEFDSKIDRLKQLLDCLA
jgi:hypothetical protein